MIGLLQLGTWSGRVAFACCIHFRLAWASQTFFWLPYPIEWSSAFLPFDFDESRPMGVDEYHIRSLKIRWRSGRATLITIHSLQFQIFRSEINQNFETEMFIFVVEFSGFSNPVSGPSTRVVTWVFRSGTLSNFVNYFTFVIWIISVSSLLMIYFNQYEINQWVLFTIILC